jgi:hypothetical protein
MGGSYMSYLSFLDRPQDAGPLLYIAKLTPRDFYTRHDGCSLFAQPPLGQVNPITCRGKAGYHAYKRPTTAAGAARVFPANFRLAKACPLEGTRFRHLPDGARLGQLPTTPFSFTESCLSKGRRRAR